jgi:hypothetical protein
VHRGARWCEEARRAQSDANHLFIKAVTGNPSEYPTLEKVFVPGLIEYVAGWVTAVTSHEA